jgi:hypothetical protein
LAYLRIVRSSADIMPQCGCGRKLNNGVLTVGGSACALAGFTATDCVAVVFFFEDFFMFPGPGITGLGTPETDKIRQWFTVMVTVTAIPDITQEAVMDRHKKAQDCKQ